MDPRGRSRVRGLHASNQETWQQRKVLATTNLYLLPIPQRVPHSLGDVTGYHHGKIHRLRMTASEESAGHQNGTCCAHAQQKKDQQVNLERSALAEGQERVVNPAQFAQ